MKTLVFFYSYSGNTRRLAQEFAAKKSADIAEITDKRRPGTLRAYSVGCLAAMRGKAWPIQPLTADLTAYDRLILLSPVWAGHTPPAVNAALERMPAGKQVEVKMVSASGQCGCKERLTKIITAHGSTLSGFEDIRGRR
jgi:flavodoxin